MKLVLLAALMSAGVVVHAQAPAPDFDVNGSAGCDAAVDALLTARYLSGFRGEALIAGLLPSNGGVTQQNVTAKLLALTASPGLALDLNGDGEIDATNDALLWSRLARGVTNPTALLTNVKSGTRDAPAMQAYFAARCATTSGMPWPVWTSAIPAVPPSTTGKTYYVARALISSIPPLVWPGRRSPTAHTAMAK